MRTTYAFLTPHPNLAEQQLGMNIYRPQGSPYENWDKADYVCNIKLVGMQLKCVLIWKKTETISRRMQHSGSLLLSSTPHASKIDEGENEHQ